MKKLDRKIFGTLFFSIFSAVTGVGIVVPLLPVYASDLGASGLYIGLIFGSFSLSRTFFLPFFGRLSDQKGRKPFIVTGLFSYGLISIAFILSKGVESLIVIRFVQGIASAMIMPVVQAYVGDITPRGKEGWVMGLFNMSLFIGLSAGPLIGGVIKDQFNLQASFYCMGALAFSSFLMSAFLLPPRKNEHVMKKKRPPKEWIFLIKDKTIAGLFFFRMAYTSGIGIIWGFLPVYADKEFSLPSSSIGVLVMLGVFVSGVVQTPMGWVADRMNRKTMMVIGGLVVSVAVYSFIWAKGFNYLFASSVLFGIGGGICMPALNAVSVQKGSESHAMGSVMALLTVGHSAGMLAGSFLAGIMMDLFQLKQAFTMGAVIMVLGTLVFVICTIKKPMSPLPGRTHPTGVDF